MYEGKRATTPDLFQVCRRHFSQPVASVGVGIAFFGRNAASISSVGVTGFTRKMLTLLKLSGRRAGRLGGRYRASARKPVRTDQRLFLKSLMDLNQASEADEYGGFFESRAATS